ncbi:MAG: cytochrome c class I [Gallionellaceae bacterium]|nr:MAG: cytochrome c class I [Gallionellaceae bacterium]
MKLTHSRRIAAIVRAALLAAGFAVVLAAQPAAAAGSNNNGQQLYMLHCAGCHGISGISVVPDAKDFSRVELMAQPDQSLLNLIRSGRNMMPPYLGILSDQEIINVINHIRTLN